MEDIIGEYLLYLKEENQNVTMGNLKFQGLSDSCLMHL